jgi:hypothetical protein
VLADRVIVKLSFLAPIREKSCFVARAIDRQSAAPESVDLENESQ